MYTTTVQPSVVNQQSTGPDTVIPTSSSISVDTHTQQSSPIVAPSKLFHVGIPSPPSDGLEAISHSQLHIDTSKLPFNNSSGDSDSETRIRNERLPIGFSPNRSEIDSPSKCSF